MEALTPQLPRKNLKMLEQELSLPKILEKIPTRLPRTSARSRKPKSEVKYVSQTAQSPEQEHLQDQIRMVLLGNVPMNWPEPPRNAPPSNAKPSKRQQSLLPRLKSQAETPAKETKRQNASPSPIIPRQGRSLSSKLDLSSILKDQSGFVSNYFAEISGRMKK